VEKPQTRAVPVTSIEGDVDAEGWADYGGWYRQDYAIFYRPAGHKDKFVQSWLLLTGLQAPKGDRNPAVAVFDLLTDKDAPGACTKCHSIDDIGDKGRIVNFSPPSVESKKGRFLRRSLRDIHDAAGLTTVFVTHDQAEALDLADRVAIMNKGIIEQVGTPVEIYDSPKSPFVFDFLGHTNSFNCTVRDGKAYLADKHLDLENHIPDGPAVAFVRPHDIVLSRADEPAKNDDVRLPGTALVRFISLGQRATIELLYEKSFIEAEMTREAIKELGLKTGTKCTISLRHPRVFARHEAEEQTRVVERASMRPRKRRRFRDRLANLR
jgi:CysA C-terminal regulatory domain